MLGCCAGADLEHRSTRKERTAPAVGSTDPDLEAGLRARPGPVTFSRPAAPHRVPERRARASGFSRDGAARHPIVTTFQAVTAPWLSR